MNPMHDPGPPATCAGSTRMFGKPRGADVLAAQLAANRDVLASLAAELQRNPPPFVATCARGSSGHAATYAKALLGPGWAWW